MNREDLSGAVSTSPVLLRDVVAGADLVAEAVVLIAEALALLLESLDVTLTLGELFLQLGDLAELTSLAETGLALLALGVAASEALVLLLEAQDVEDHGVGAVEDEGEEEGEATEVHVALRVELAGLDFHALAASDGTLWLLALVMRLWGESRSLLGCAALLLGHGELDLDPVDAVDAVDEQDENEDEGDLDFVSISRKMRHDFDGHTFMPY